MKVIIMGCGRVGTQVAQLMASEGHDVTVIDQDPSALDRLGQDLPINKIKGVGFDRAVLLKAGIDHAEAFAATSPSDNANIVAARIARNIFHVPRVVARLYDPRRAEIYRRLGLRTISSTTWGAERIRELLIYTELEPSMAFGSGEVIMTSLEISPVLDRRMVRDLSVPGEIMVVAITRQGHAFMPVSGTEFRSGDLVQLIVLASSLERLRALLGSAEGG
jgi:trk system potassium uptake protein TrkA